MNNFLKRVIWERECLLGQKGNGKNIPQNPLFFFLFTSVFGIKKINQPIPLKKKEKKEKKTIVQKTKHLSRIERSPKGHKEICGCKLICFADVATPIHFPFSSSLLPLLIQDYTTTCPNSKKNNFFFFFFFFILFYKFFIFASFNLKGQKKRKKKKKGRQNYITSSSRNQTHWPSST